MKKVYTLAAASLVAGIAYTSVAEAKVNKNISDYRMVQTEKAVAMEPSERVASQKGETRAEEWKSLGETSFREFIFSSLYRGLDPYELPCELEQSTSNPANYRIPNLYQEFVAEFWEGTGYIVDDTAEDTYFYINTFEKDGKTYWYLPEDCDLGFFVDGQVTGLTSGQAFMVFNISGMIAQQGVDKAFETYPDCFGTFENGVFTIGKNFIGSSGNAYPCLFWYTTGMEAGYGVACNTKKQFALAMPGTSLPEPPDPFKDYTFVGSCQMQQNFLDNLFQEWTTPVGTVEVYEEPDFRGYFHIKNAYVAGAWNNPEVAQEIDLEINLHDPSFGELRMQSTGYIDLLEFGEIDICSASMVYTAYVEEKDAITKEQFLADETLKPMNLYIDPDTKRIVMPGMSVWYNVDVPETHELYGMIFNAGQDSKESWIQLPADYVLPSGIGSVVADDANAPVKYFNLQGMEVKAPEAGQLVIMKKGSKATKMIAE